MRVRLRASAGLRSVTWLAAGVCCQALSLLTVVTGTASAAQSEPPRPVYAPILKTERIGAGVVRIAYDLDRPSDTAFTVSIEASTDGGGTCAIRPSTTRGDVGPGIKPGTGKVIEWDSAKNIDDLLNP